MAGPDAAMGHPGDTQVRAPRPERRRGLAQLTRVAMVRRAWIVIAAVLLVTEGAIVLSDLAPRRAVTESVVLVPSGAGRAGPGAAAEATRLAVTYAAAIPSDAGVLQEAARRLHTTPDAISESIEVRNEPNTALLRIRFSAPTEAQALEGASAILTPLASATPSARAVAGNSLRLVRPPRVVSTRASKTPILVLGLLLGLAIGLALVTVAERLDPRLDDADQLARTLGADAIALAALFPGGAGALLERWRFTSKSPAPQVALVAGTPAMQHAMPAVGERLRAALEADGVEDVTLLDGTTGDERWPSRVAERPDEVRGVDLLVVGMPGEASFVEWAALVADVVVIAVPSGVRQRRLTAALKRLEMLADTRPDWGLLVTPGDLSATAGAPGGDGRVGGAGRSIGARRLPRLQPGGKAREARPPRA